MTPWLYNILEATLYITYSLNSFGQGAPFYKRHQTLLLLLVVQNDPTFVKPKIFKSVSKTRPTRLPSWKNGRDETPSDRGDAGDLPQKIGNIYQALPIIWW